MQSINVNVGLSVVLAAFILCAIVLAA